MPEPWEVFGAQQTAQAQQEPWQAFGQPAAAAAQPAAEAPINWSDVPGQALRNFPSSFGGVLHDIAQPFIHPIETATNLKNLTIGVLQKTGMVSGDDAVKYADAFGQYFANRYGSAEGFKRALAKDPAGVLADASALFTGGETALARAPGMVGRAAEVAGTVGRAIDPLNAITKPAAAAVRLADYGLGPATGVGRDVIQAARQAGYEGGAASEALRDQMRGTAPITEIVSDARAAADQMRRDAQARYVQDMASTSRNPTQLSFNDIDAALNRVDNMVSPRGAPPRQALVGVRDDLNNLVNQWKALNPTDWHTPAGFDELKKRIYEDVLGNIPFEQKAQRKIAGDVYDAVKGTIVKQDPQYAKTMAAYEKASTQLREIEKTLTGRPGAPVDQALRKLTSVMRNNVNTNYGRRAQLAQMLQAAGAPQLTNKIAGASLNAATPRGLATLGPTLGIGGLLTGTLPLTALPSLAATSPRVVGETQRAIGAGQRLYGQYGRPSLQALRQLGRPSNIPQFQ